MSKFKKLMEKANENLIWLNHVKVIREGDEVFPEWLFLKNEYDENQDSDWGTKALITLTNSLVTQRRVFFGISRDGFRKIAEADKNWKTPIGLDNNNWKKLIGKAYSCGLIKEVKTFKVRGKDRVMYELIDKDILNLIMIDKEKQKAETEQYISEDKKPESLADSIADASTDTGSRNQKIDISNKEEVFSSIDEDDSKVIASLDEKLPAKEKINHTELILTPSSESPLPLKPTEFNDDVVNSIIWNKSASPVALREALADWIELDSKRVFKAISAHMMTREQSKDKKFLVSIGLENHFEEIQKPVLVSRFGKGRSSYAS